jgi:hypothetical protein
MMWEMLPAARMLSRTLGQESLLLDELNAPAEHLVAQFLTARHEDSEWARTPEALDTVGRAVTRFQHVEHGRLAELAALYGMRTRPVGGPAAGSDPVPVDAAEWHHAMKCDVRFLPMQTNPHVATVTFNILAATDDGTGTLFELLNDTRRRGLSSGQPKVTLDEFVQAYLAATEGAATAPGAEHVTVGIRTAGRHNQGELRDRNT